jgi:hypothetical protein
LELTAASRCLIDGTISEGATNMAEALASKTCTLCRGEYLRSHASKLIGTVG